MNWTVPDQFKLLWSIEIALQMVLQSRILENEIFVYEISGKCKFSLHYCSFWWAMKGNISIILISTGMVIFGDTFHSTSEHLSCFCRNARQLEFHTPRQRVCLSCSSRRSISELKEQEINHSKNVKYTIIYNQRWYITLIWYQY